MFRMKRISEKTHQSFSSNCKFSKCPFLKLRLSFRFENVLPYCFGLDLKTDGFVLTVFRHFNIHWNLLDKQAEAEAGVEAEAGARSAFKSSRR